MDPMAKALSAYSRESLMTRLHLFTRSLVCPFGQILPYLPRKGRILDVGCGHGIFPNLMYYDPRNEAREICGTDHADNKIEVARRNAPAKVAFSNAPLRDMVSGSFDAISIVDVLYTVKLDRWKAILDECYRLLRPGGVLIVKEVIDRPRWKLFAIMLEERLAVDILKITKGEEPHWESAERYRDAVEQSGFTVTEARPLKAAGWISHYLLVSRKP